MLTGPVLTLRHFDLFNYFILSYGTSLSSGTYLPYGAYPFENFKFCKRTLKVLDA